MVTDKSEGYEDIAEEFLEARSNVGSALIKSWAMQHIPPSACVLDVGCGPGIPVTEVLDALGFEIYAIDASPSLLAKFRKRFPNAKTACESAQESSFFNHMFDGAVAIGLIFLLTPDDQRAVIQNIAAKIKPGGRFLFSAPKQTGEWKDNLTNRTSYSLGEANYKNLICESGLTFIDYLSDENGNNYYDTAKPTR